MMGRGAVERARGGVPEAAKTGLVLGTAAGAVHAATELTRPSIGRRGAPIRGPTDRTLEEQQRVAEVLAMQPRPVAEREVPEPPPAERETPPPLPGFCLSTGSESSNMPAARLLRLLFLARRTVLRLRLGLFFRATLG
jgi:hypothetical protein